MKFKALKRKSGFTLVEIMVTVSIISLLTSISVPAVMSAKDKALAASLANNFRTYAAAFEIYCMEEGSWPADGMPGEVPAGMEERLPKFAENTYQDGKWDWEHNAVGVTAGVSLRLSTINEQVLARIDKILDDGDLTAGNFRSTNGNGVTYILEQ
jgi:prepilin-type N-terminal cleavage/methylation domain-containing protein